jgi:hypothetical protein
MFVFVREITLKKEITRKKQSKTTFLDSFPKEASFSAISSHILKTFVSRYAWLVIARLSCK